jgi:hypothetical protein
LGTYALVCLQDDVVRETIVAVGAGSGAGLTEVQIGSAVEGEDEGGLACYRYLAEVSDGLVPGPSGVLNVYDISSGVVLRH